MSTGRALLCGAGVALAAYGGFLLLTRLSPADLGNAAVWLAAGVILHDAVLAPAVLLAGLLGSRALPAPVRGPVATGAVVLGAVTLLAVPVLGRFGARPDNPTLLDRDYGAGWLLLAGLTVVGVAGASVIRSRRRPAPPAQGGE